jgi:hypothetical protein
MNERSDKVHEDRDALDIAIWENEGGASRGTHQYGRREETHRFWTLFTDRPKRMGVDLNRSDAADRMISVTTGNRARRNGRLSLDPPSMDVFEIRKIRP